GELPVTGGESGPGAADRVGRQASVRQGGEERTPGGEETTGHQRPEELEEGEVSAHRHGVENGRQQLGHPVNWRGHREALREWCDDHSQVPQSLPDVPCFSYRPTLPPPVQPPAGRGDLPETRTFRVFAFSNSRKSPSRHRPRPAIRNA